jgi:hypothetical protein
MILSRECACGQKVEFEADDLPQLTCPACGRSLKDQFAPAPVAVREPVSSRSDSGAFSRQAVLESVRSQSCYQNLRGLIEAVFLIAVLVFAIIIALDLAVIFQRSDSIPPNLLYAEVAIAVACMIGIGIAGAAKQAALLGVDAADILIANRADRIAEQALTNTLGHSQAVDK